MSLTMGRKGLTLLEILIVVSIIGMVSASLSVAFRSGVLAWSKASSRLELYQNVRVALDQISRDLVGAIEIEGSSTLAGTAGAGTAPDSLKFFTMSGGNIYELEYTVVDTDTDTVPDTMKRRYVENPSDYDFGTADAGASGTEDVAYGISNLQLKYWNGDGASPTTGWDTNALDDWTANGLPRALRITVTATYKNQMTGADETRPFETVVYLPDSY